MDRMKETARNLKHADADLRDGTKRPYDAEEAVRLFRWCSVVFAGDEIKTLRAVNPWILLPPFGILPEGEYKASAPF